MTFSFMNFYVPLNDPEPIWSFRLFWRDHSRRRNLFGSRHSFPQPPPRSTLAVWPNYVPPWSWTSAQLAKPGTDHRQGGDKIFSCTFDGLSTTPPLLFCVWHRSSLCPRWSPSGWPPGWRRSAAGRGSSRAPFGSRCGPQGLWVPTHPLRFCLFSKCSISRPIFDPLVQFYQISFWGFYSI